jgi:prepilin-type N-terminal cleavage/methylation domain-containing protein
MNRVPGFSLLEIMIVVTTIGLLALIAVPAFMKARTQSQMNTCVNNLRQMHAAKQQAALENNWSENDSAGTIGNPFYKDTISAYLKHGERPICPTGPDCFYNAIKDPPNCLSGLPGHVYE